MESIEKISDSWVLTGLSLFLKKHHSKVIWVSELTVINAINLRTNIGYFYDFLYWLKIICWLCEINCKKSILTLNLTEMLNQKAHSGRPNWSQKNILGYSWICLIETLHWSTHVARCEEKNIWSTKGENLSNLKNFVIVVPFPYFHQGSYPHFCFW